MKATITSLIFLLLSLTVSSQTYKYIGIEEGLSNQKIYKIQKDARGYMWFLTHVGIDQYNGKEIKTTQTSIIINEGNSGGPLFNADGELIGLITFRLRNGSGEIIQGVSFALHYSVLKDFLE